LQERASTPPTAPRLARRSIQLALVATLVALLPLVLLARLTTARAQEAVRDEVAARLRVTTRMSAALLAEQVASFVTLLEADAKCPRLVRAVAGGALEAHSVQGEGTTFTLELSVAEEDWTGPTEYAYTR
jgi:hypothetical protein